MLVYKPRIRRSETGWKIADISILIIEHNQFCLLIHVYVFENSIGSKALLR